MPSMKAGSEESWTFRKVRAEALRRAALIAEAEESVLAVDYWNSACRRVAKRLKAEAEKLETEVSIANNSEPFGRTRHR